MNSDALKEDDVLLTLAAAPGTLIFTGLIVIGLGVGLGVSKIRKFFSKKK